MTSFNYLSSIGLFLLVALVLYVAYTYTQRSQGNARAKFSVTIIAVLLLGGIGLNLLSYKPAGEDGFFVLLAAPGIAADAQQVVARDIVLVLDVSGSMQGEKIEQARKAAHFVVDHLNPGDRFNLISFSTGAHLWQSKLQPADAQAIKTAHGWINTLVATGSTDINRALLEALAQLNNQNDRARPGYLLFLTDGLPTVGETDAQRILANTQNNQPAQNRIRLFTFGVGFDVNTDLLDALSQDLGGRSSYVKPNEAIDEKVGQFYSGISTPVLVDVTLDWGNQAKIDEVYPYPLPDLFAGEQLVVAGRDHQGGALSLTLRGMVNGQKVSYHYSGQTLVTSGGEAFVARLWATRKIGVLLDQIRRNGPDKELVDEITQLSLQYGIVTPYTAYLVTEAPAAQTQGGQAQDGQTPEATRDSVYAQAQAAAAAPASGEAAVKASETRSALREATQVAENQAMRYVNGKAFVQQEVVTTPDGQAVALWVDTQYTPSMALEKVRFGTPRYFELLKQPNLARWLAVSSELIVVVEKGKAIRISNSQ
jgi:Ca-activated chloride channel family protein